LLWTSGQAQSPCLLSLAFHQQTRSNFPGKQNNGSSNGQQPANLHSIGSWPNLNRLFFVFGLAAQPVVIADTRIYYGGRCHLDRFIGFNGAPLI
jgi:hypothetical protein